MASFDTAKYYPLVKNVDIKFIGMATTPCAPRRASMRTSSTRVETEAAENGKADYRLDAVVSDETGQVVATTRGLYQLRAHRN